MQTITQTHEDRARLKAIEAALQTDLTLEERCDLQDEADEIKTRLGDLVRSKCEDEEGCLFCGS